MPTLFGDLLIYLRVVFCLSQKWHWLTLICWPHTLLVVRCNCEFCFAQVMQKLTTGCITAWGSKSYYWVYHCLRLKNLLLGVSLPEAQKLTTGCITAWGSKAYNWIYHCLRLKSLQLDVSLPEAQKLTTGCITAWGSYWDFTTVLCSSAGTGASCITCRRVPGPQYPDGTSHHILYI
jgi:hypothetical protein